MVQEFYNNLFTDHAGKQMSSGRLSSHGAAHALHYATQHIREMLDDSESSLLTWAPYVHVGI